MSSPDFILASGSPRRRLLLQQLAMNFSIERPDVDESVRAGEQAEDYVRRLSVEKSEAPGIDDSIVLAADTTVVLDQGILGKPASLQECRDMLSAMSGREHEVLTGVTVREGARSDTICVSTTVRFREIAEQEIDYYWQTGEPKDKAGAYGLQGIGAAFVASLNGSYTNVIGLPLVETLQLLRHYGIRWMNISSQE